MTRDQAREYADFQRALQDVVKTASGKRVLFWFLEQASIYADPYAGEDAATNYRIGRQSVGRRLIAELDALDPRTYPRLMLDLADLKAMEQAAREAAQPGDDDYAD